ncbi:MAG TPA: TolC family protein [Cyclobacteriaceae bacterium]|nr:TolC family protein [Cyclobacteriaceae bacterium]
MNRKTFLLSLTLIFSVVRIRAQEIKPATADMMRFSLQQAIEYAQKNSLNVKNAALDIESTKKQVWEYTAMGLPQVNGNATYTNLFNVPVMPFGSQFDPNSLPDDVALTKDDILGAMSPPIFIELGVKENIQYDVSVNQLIFSGQYIVGLYAMKTLKQLSDQALMKSKFDARLSVSQSYYLVLVSEEGLKILQSSLELINKTLDDMTKMNQQGLIEDTDVDQIRVNKSNVENLLRSTTAQSELAYRLLKFQMGLDLHQPISLTDNLNMLIQAGNFQVQSYVDFNINNNIDYRMMRTSETLAMLNFRKEKSTALPTVGAYYRHLELVKTPQFNFNFPDLLAVNLTVPIFTSGMYMARVARARIALEKTENQREMLEQGLNINYEQSKINFDRALNDYLNLKQSMELSDKIYKKTLLKYSEGVSSSLELTQAQNQFLMTQSGYYNSILNLFNAQTALERLLATE